MISQACMTAVAQATVQFPDRGQGVLVPGHRILTAAHVIKWTHTGQMALGDHEDFMQVIKVAGGRRILVYPVAIEPVADLAILGALEAQMNPKEAAAFEQFCGQTPPVPLDTTEYPYDTPISAHIFAHTGTWIPGSVRQFQPKAPNLSLESDAPILAGTSGSPVVTDKGRLLGVVSSSTGSGPTDGSPIPRPHLAAPAWLVPQLRGRARPSAWKYYEATLRGRGVEVEG